MLMFGYFPFEVLSSVMKYAICSSLIVPLMLIGMILLGGILSGDLTVPIVAL